MNQTNLPTASPLEAHLGFWLRFVSNHVSGRFQALLEDRAISITEWVALRTLYEQNGTSHSELIQKLGMTKGAASKVITRLEEKGLAERRLVDGRAREQLLVLTAAGQQLVPELAALADENDAYFLGHLSEPERATLMAQLQEIVRIHQLKSLPVD